jgi:O-antigen ligase
MTAKVWPPEAASSRSGRGVPAPEQAIIIASAALLFASILTFGADRNDFSLLFSGSFACLLFVVLLSQGWARAAIIKRGNALLIPACLFALTCLSLGWAATPFGPNGSHPIWAYVATVPAISIDRSAIFVGLAKLSGLACVFLLGWVICSSDDRSRYFMRTIVASSAIYGIWSLLANLIPGLKFGIYGAFQDHRLSGSFQSANTAGTLFGISFILALCFMFEESRRAGAERGALVAKITVPIIAGGLLATCLVMTASRGAATATLASCAVFLIWEMFARDWHSIQKRNFAFGLAAAGALLVLAWGGGLLADRYADSVKDWIDQRQIIYSVHWDAFLASPWFGYGVGTFDQVNKLLQTAINYPTLWNIRAAHNVYLQWLEQGGIAGAAAMFACIGWIIANTALATRSRRRMTTWLRGAVALSLVVLIHGWSDFSLEVPAIAMLWSLLLGSGYGISTSSRSSQGPNYSQSSALLTPNSISYFRSISGVAGFAIFGAIIAIVCFLSWWQIAAPFGAQPMVLPISNVLSYRAQTLLEPINLSRPSEDDIAAAATLTQRELRLSPAQAEGWLRLALIASLQGRPVAEMSEMVDRSYLVAPLDPQLFVRRTRFVLEHWDHVSPTVRQEALAQIRIGWNNWIEKAEITRLGSEVHNSAGRLAIHLVVAELSSKDGLAATSGP